MWSDLEKLVIRHIPTLRSIGEIGNDRCHEKPQDRGVLSSIPTSIASQSNTAQLRRDFPNIICVVFKSPSYAPFQRTIKEDEKALLLPKPSLPRMRPAVTATCLTGSACLGFQTLSIQTTLSFNLNYDYLLRTPLYSPIQLSHPQSQHTYPLSHLDNLLSTA